MREYLSDITKIIAGISGDQPTDGERAFTAKINELIEIGDDASLKEAADLTRQSLEDWAHQHGYELPPRLTDEELAVYRQMPFSVIEYKLGLGDRPDPHWIAEHEVPIEGKE